MIATASDYLSVYLEPLAEQLRRDDVTDIYINRPGEIWVETLGGEIELQDVADLSEAHLGRLARQIASVSHQGVNRENPLLGASLPDGLRVQIIAPPATRGPMAMAIRKHLSTSLSLDDLSGSGVFEGTSGHNAPKVSDKELENHYERKDWQAFIGCAVRARKTILVSGGTSTGKTTLLNAMLREIPSQERLILIEDAPELVLHHQNAVGLVAVRSELGETKVSPEDLLIASLRMRPDRIILGELRGGEAFTFLRAANSGHPGSLTTIHADSPEQAMSQLAFLVLRAASAFRYAEAMEYTRQTVDIVVQLQRSAGSRRVGQIDWISR
jgi:type IV secretion system protein VirB11